jgi:hypothetical protein
VLGLCAIAALAQPACAGVVLDAPNVALLVRDTDIVFASNADAARLVGGETVLELRNDGQQERRLVLAKLAAGDARVPPEIRDADDVRDDSRIVAMTRTLEAKESTLAAGGLGFKIDGASMHIYLAPGARYVVFDTIGDAVELIVEPGR